ncbi:MAG: hypothetical protein JWM10_5151 [Myxococcaceae bacterium]|nr:hypothetical protein [Myxococcaceae bacterium]
MIRFDRASAADDASTSAHSRHVALWSLAVAASLVIGPRGPLYWDSLGYVEQALTGRVGGLLLGRPLFVLASHLAARVALALGASPWSLEALLRNLWLGVAALAAPLAATLARRVGLTPRAALLAGLLVALSPAGAHTRDAVLTDGPATAMVLLALAVRAGSTPSPALGALAAGALVGVAFGLREQAAIHLATALLVPVAGLPRRSWRDAALLAAGFALVAAIVLALAWSTNPDYPATIARWARGMAAERREARPPGESLRRYALWLVALSPVALVATVAWWSRRRDAWWPLVVPATLGLAALSRYQDIAFSPRYLLTEFVVATTLPAAAWLDRALPRRAAQLAWIIPSLVLLLVGGRWLDARQRPLRALVAALPDDLRAVDPGALIVTGQPCAAVRLDARVARAFPAAWGAAPPRWSTLCPGWSWPADPAARLAAALEHGSAVVLDLRRAAWMDGPQQRRRAEVEAFARAHAGDPRVISWRDAPTPPR